MGELARKPGTPELPKTPLELLTPRPTKGYNTIDTYMLPALGATGGVFSAIFSNNFRKRPIYAGIHRHIIYGLAGWYIFTVIGDWKKESRMDRDAVLRHYITLHPDEFPPFERKRIGEVFGTWTPIR